MLFVQYAVAVAILATQFLPANADELANEPDTPPVAPAKPTSLNDVIPTCSRFCVDMFVESNYPPIVCSDPADFECLCTKNSTSGLTIGEGATSCVASFCLDVSPFLSSSLLNICLHYPGAMPNNHRSNTMPFLPAPSSETRQSTSSASSTTTNTNTITRTTSMAAGTFTNTVSRTTGTATGTFTVNGGAQEITPPPSKPSQSMEKLSDPAIIAISIVGGVALILAVALLYLCLRRRRQKSMAVKSDIANESGDGLPDVPLDPVPKYETVSRNTGTVTRQTAPAHTDPIPPPPAMSRTAKESPTPGRADEIGVAIYPDYIEESSNSQISRRTDSQLLPDKPNYSLYPEPLRWGHAPVPVPPNRESYMTVFEEDMLESNKAPCRPAVAGCSHGVGLPSDPRALMYAMERKNKLFPCESAGIPAQQSNTALYMPAEGNYQNFVTMPTLPSGHPQARHAASFGQVPMCSNKHCSSQVRGPAHTLRTQNRQACSHISQSHPDARRDTSDSFISNTTSSSRDSCNEEDHSLPNRGSDVVARLSPVQEASTSSNNTAHSPPQSATSVSYPKMPRSASIAQQAETVHKPRAIHLIKTNASSSRPRKNSTSPNLATTTQPKTQQHEPQSVDLFLCPQHSPSASGPHSDFSTGNTLLAKRRGGRVADKMENSLHLSPIPKSSPSKDNASRFQGNLIVAGESTNTKAATGNGSSSTEVHKEDSVPSREVIVFGPDSHREVRLTPTRKGPDLFLNVEHR